MRTALLIRNCQHTEDTKRSLRHLFRTNCNCYTTKTGSTGSPRGSSLVMGEVVFIAKSTVIQSVKKWPFSYETWMLSYALSWVSRMQSTPLHITTSTSPLIQILCFWTLSIILFLPKNTVLSIFRNNVSETGFCLRLQVKYTKLGPIDRASPYLPSSIDWAQLSRYYLKTETESSLRNIVFWDYKQECVLDENSTMDNVQKHIYTNVSSSQTFRSCPL
jgi:hypothetical protein